MSTRFAPWNLVLAGVLALALSGSAALGAAGQPAVSDSAAEGPVLVFAAASLTDVLEEIDAAFTASTGVHVRASYAASSVLAKQIEAGAPADIFLSADKEWMDYLESHQLLKDGSRRDLLGNQLVLIAPASSPVQLKLVRGMDLAGALKGGRLASGDPDSVPAGIYARQALTQLGAWEAIADHLVRAENVRAALAYVARGEAPLGIVYRTDALAEKRVRIVDTFPGSSHPPINYPVARTLQSNPDARRYSDFLLSEAGRAIFTKYGFVPLGDVHPVHRR
jgi:molybdate transport system substrate-binding protein